MQGDDDILVQAYAKLLQAKVPGKAKGLSKASALLKQLGGRLGFQVQGPEGVLGQAQQRLPGPRPPGPLDQAELLGWRLKECLAKLSKDYPDLVLQAPLTKQSSWAGDKAEMLLILMAHARRLCNETRFKERTSFRWASKDKEKPERSQLQIMHYHDSAQLQDEQAAEKDGAARELFEHKQEMTEIRDNSDAEWEDRQGGRRAPSQAIQDQVSGLGSHPSAQAAATRRGREPGLRSQDLDRILLLKRRQLDEDVNLACAGHQARYDSDVSKHLQKLKLEAYKAKESTPDLKARIDQETTLLHQQARAQEMMDLMDHLRAQVGLPKAAFEAPQSHDLLGLQEAEQARDAEQARASTDQARPSTDQGRASTDQAQGTTPQDTTMEPPPNPREPAQDGDGQGDGQGHGGHGQGEGWPTTWQDPGMASAVDPGGDYKGDADEQFIHSFGWDCFA
eukprot:s7688_g1.t1